jgi:uncharacterized protein (TIGR00251 family)
MEVRVIVQTRARQTGFAGEHAGYMKIRVAEQPLDGRANAALRRFLAEAFRVPLSRVLLLSGTSSRRKRLLITKPRQVPAEISDYLV